MRGFLLSLALLFAVGTAVPARANVVAAATPTISAPGSVIALQVPDKTIDINVNTRGGAVAWYRNPVWIAIGILALIVVLLLIVLVARGGGTTIVRD